ncbi:MAG: MipA/OmpV family protein [Caulobacter sp.]
MFRPALLALAGLIASTAATTAHGQAQPFAPVEAEARWRLDVGGGVVRGFSVGGSDTDKANFTPWGSISYRDRVYANGLDGLGWNVVKTPTLRAGVQLRPRFAAGEIEDSTLQRPDLGADAAVYGFWRGPRDYVVGARVQRDATGDGAGWEYFASIAKQQVTPVGLVQTMAYVRGGDDDRLQRYYGVRAEDAPGSGFNPYEAKGGLSGAGAVALLAVPIGQRFGLGGFINYEAILGDAADSPFLKDDHVWRAGLIGVVRLRSMD